MAIDNAQLSTGSPIEFTVPANQSWAFTTILVCNKGVGSCTFSLYAVKDTEAVSDTKNKIVNTATVEAGDTFIMDSEKIILEDGDKLSFQQNGGTNGDLLVTVSYIIV
jgi:hypothetical protein